MSDDLAKQMIMELTARVDRLERIIDRAATAQNFAEAFMMDSMCVGHDAEGRPVFHFHGMQGPLRVAIDHHGKIIDLQCVRQYGVHENS